MIPNQVGSTTSPRVSVVIPLFNKKATIRRAIESVVTQSMGDFELIIVNDGSTDGSDQLVDAIQDPRVRLIMQSNAGPGAARNRGGAEAAAKLLAFLDGDDEWDASFLDSAVTALERNEHCIAYVCGYNSGAFRTQRPNKVSSLGKVAGPAALDLSLEGREIKMHVDALHSSCAVVRTETFRTLGGFYDKGRCVYGEDSYLWARLLFSGPIYWDPIERTMFHVEDSDLGFATKSRSIGRPLSLYGRKVSGELPEPMRMPFQRMLAVFAQQDVDVLLASGALQSAFAVRRANGTMTATVLVRDIYKYVRYLLSNHER